MPWIYRVLCAVAAVVLIAHFSGCCCSCGDSNWLKSLVPPPGAGDNNNPQPDQPELDPAAAEELATARENAQKALSAKGYGTVNSAELSKDGLNWYVTGTVSDLAGGNPDYSVWFEVKRVGNSIIWAVKSVTVDGKVVYP